MMTGRLRKDLLSGLATSISLALATGRPMTGYGASADAGIPFGAARASAFALAARSRELDVATEMLLTKAEHVSDDGARLDYV